MSVFRSGARDESDADIVTERVLTVPNLISLVRLVALPLIYLDIVGGRSGRALVVLMAVAWSDWIDGYVARRFDQVSRLGRLADPVTDRLLVAVVGIALVVADIVPLWAVAVLLVRDVVVVVGGAVLYLMGRIPPAVTELGKAATFGLMGALPMFLLAEWAGSPDLRGGAWLLLGSFGVLYYAAAVQYVHIVRSDTTSGDADRTT